MTDLELEQSQLIEKLKLEIQELKEKLKKYTNPKRNKKFYENNKEEIIKKSNDRLKNLPNEKLQEYRRRAYIKLKEKQKDLNK
jgi:hypothetical protein